MRNISTSLKKGFTLVELLIVIAILAVLATATVVVLNPAELLAQARDSQRISDMDTLKNTLAIYIAQVTPLNLGAVSGCVASGGGRCTALPTALYGPFGTAGAASATCVNTTPPVRTTAGGGWVDVNFGGIPGGSPIPMLPIDPTNSATGALGVGGYYYGYMCDVTYSTFELSARIESVKYRSKMPFDGGNRNCLCGGVACTAANVANMTDTEAQAVACFYEVGTDPGFDL
jgi:prepilin-type N-terminal cleavage/methylation domain-containing protein